MKLDSRIKDILYIANCFTTKLYRNYIGTECYFSNEISNFANLDNCTKGKLDAVYDDSILPYGSDSKGFKFCLAPIYVKQKETELRPFTLEEFNERFEFGEYVTFRFKDRTHYFCLPYLGYEYMSETEDDPNEDGVNFGAYAISLQSLFDNYEYYVEDGEQWLPFGVEG